MSRSSLIRWKNKHKSGRIYWNYMGLIVVILFGEHGYEEWAAHRMKIYGKHYV